MAKADTAPKAAETAVTTSQSTAPVTEPQEASDESTAPQGWDEVGTPDVDGWWSPEAGYVITGKLVGRLRLSQDGAKRDVLLVKITQACIGKKPGEDASVTFPVGSVIGVGVRHKLRNLLLYVKHKGMIWVKALNKAKLKGKTMWNFDVKAQGKKATPDPVNVNTDEIDGDGQGEDDIPF